MTRFSTVAEVSAALRISKSSVHRMLDAGALPCYRFGRVMRIPTQAVWDYIRGQRIDPDSVAQVDAL